MVKFAIITSFSLVKMSLEEFICEEEELLVDEPEEVEKSATPEVTGFVSAKKKTVGVKVKCHRLSCNRAFKDLDAYRRHLRLHIAEDLYKSAPGLEVAKEVCRPKATVILSEMSVTESTSELRKHACQIALQLHTQAECNIFGFVDLIISELWCCFPPAAKIDPAVLNSKYVFSVSQLLADLDKRRTFAERLRDEITPLDCHKDGKVLDWFISDFVFKLSDTLEAFYLRSIRNPCDTILVQSGQSDIEDSEEGEEDERSIKFKQTIHYMGGSVVKSVFRLARKSKKSDKWTNIIQCMCTKFVCGLRGNNVDEEISKWTESRNRGGLTFVSESCWAFFMAVSGVLERNEKNDGSLIYEDILSAVKSDNVVMFLWSDLVGNGNEILSDDESETLLKYRIRFYVNAWGRGVALRRKNEIVGRSRDKVPLRSKLCSS